MNKKWIILILVLVIAVLAIGIIYANDTKTSEKTSNNFKIVTTFYPIYIMTANITEGAQNIQLVNMTDVNVGCLHDYTLSTADMKKIEKANVIVQNGLGLENFMDKILNTYSDINIIDSSKSIKNKIEDAEEINPHIWTSIENYIIQVEEIASQLSEMNPENATIYEANKEDYIKKLQALKLKYNTGLTNINGKKAICLNEALTYLTKEVGIEITSVKTDHEESSLSAETMKELINKMTTQDIKIILVGNEDNQKSAETLANETGAKIYTLKSGLIGNMDKDAYIKAMNDNFEQLKQIR